MDFEEWFNSLELDNWTNKKHMHDAFEAGQQSKQAEIDALKAKIDAIKVVMYAEVYYHTPTLIKDIKELLR